MITFRQARRLAVIRFGEPEDVYLAVSLDRRTTLTVGWFRVGPRGGRQPRYAVRLGIEDGCAFGGCCMFDDAAAALECFERYAAAGERTYKPRPGIRAGVGYEIPPWEREVNQSA